MSELTIDFSLTLTQRDIYFDQICNPESACYNIGGYIRLCAVDQERLQAAHAQLVKTHDVFGMRIVVSESGCRQCIVCEDKRSAGLPMIDLSAQANSEDVATQWIRSLFEAPISYENAELFKAFLIKLSNSEYWYVGIAHHLMSDGWGFVNWSHALAAYYNLPEQEQHSLCWQDVAAEDVRYQSSERYKRDRDYWQNELGLLPERLLATRYNDNSQNIPHRSFRHVVPLTPDQSHSLHEMAQSIGVSVAHVLMGTLAYYFGLTQGQTDLILGIPIHNRRGQAQKGAINVFTSVSPLRLSLESGQTFSQFLGHIADRQKNNFRHQRYPIGDIVRDLGLSGGHQKIYDVGFSYLQFEDDVEFDGDRSKLFYVSHNHEGTPLLVTAWDCDGQIEIKLDCNKKYFSESDAYLLGERLRHLLNVVITQPEKQLTLADCIPQNERAKLLTTFNATDNPFPGNALIHELFELKAAEQPNATAAIYDDQSISYSELNARANQLAHYLIAQGIRPDDRVAICVERSLDMLVGLIAILKSGAGYVPMDPSYPSDRLAFMLADCEPKLLLTQSALAEHLPNATVPVLMLDAAYEVLASHSAKNPDAHCLGLKSSHLAYLIYTSGSTGQPKGVMVEHRSVINLWSSLERTIFHALATDARVGQNAPITFDVSVQSLVQLLSGRQIVVIPQSVRLDAKSFLQYARRHRIEAFDCTPMQLDTLLKEGLLNEVENASIRLVVVAGEAISSAMWATLRAAKSICFYNAYGPTECTVYATEYALNQADETPIIGHPIANTKIYLLNSNAEPVPIGAIGEIYIGGEGVARGYLNRPQLTNERFLADPFCQTRSARVYKTGDLARWLPDGNIEYLGRNDFQVKIRGFRVELGEIESRLSSYAGVRDVAVLAREDVPGDKRLVAYLVANDGAELSPTALRQMLESQLPPFMVPSAFVLLDALPQTSNGKLDRKALPAPDSTAVVHQDYEAPQGNVECAVANIWQTLLGVKQVGRNDHFFALGGHSMLAVQLVDRLRANNLKAEARAIFLSPLLRDFAATLVPLSVATETLDTPPNKITLDTQCIRPDMLPLVTLTQAEIEKITASVGGVENIQDIYPLLPLQEGMLFHHLMQSDGDTYVLRTVLAFDHRERLDAFMGALNQVISRHDILRTIVLWEDLAQPVQVVLRKALLPTIEMPSVEAPLDVLLGRTEPRQLRLDLRRAPLMAAYATPDQQSGEWLLELSAHHLICDHETLSLIMSEVQALLSGSNALLPVSVPFRTIVAQTLNTPRAEHEPYFRQLLADVDEPSAPFGVLNMQVSASTRKMARYPLSTEWATRIRDCARQLGVSSSALFHSAWALVLARCTDRDDAVFGTVLSGRMQGEAGLANALGLLINTLPVRIFLAQHSVRDAVLECHKQLVSLMAHERAPLSLALQCSAVPASLPLFTSLLNYRHSVPQAQGTELPLAVAGVRVVHTEESANYPVAVQVDDFGHDFCLSTHCAEGMDAERITDYFRIAVENITQALEIQSTDTALTLDVLSTAERSQLVSEFNTTTSSYNDTALIHEMFERQVRGQPNVVAVSHGDDTMDFATLNARANQLAHYLRNLGIKPDDRVAVYLERGMDLIVSVLGVLKAGGAYVPLDPTYPEERLNFMLVDSAPKALLTQTSLSERLQSHSLPKLVIDAAQDCAELAIQPDHDLPAQKALNGHCLAYVIYTSGSTGEPKGVMIEHHSVVRLVTTRDYVTLDNNTVMAQASNTSFDAATFEIWGALLNGGRLVIVDKDTLVNADRLAMRIRDNGINTLFVTTALFNHHAHNKPDCFAQLHTLLFGGEAVSPNAVAAIVNQGMPTRLLHVYGPTEATTFSTWFNVTPDCVVNASNLPIGRGFADTRVYVLTPSLQPVPVGVAGELYVAGPGLARGYLNQAEFTQQRFLKDPFTTESNARMYKTGDRVRWLPGGVLEFLGRRDFQIKLRGFRVELGEIESKLITHPDVREALVLLREDIPGDKRLVAYLSSHNSAPLSVAELRTYIAQHLPEYMIPSAFVVLESLPLTPNGKLNRKALPAPANSAMVHREYLPPLGDAEEALAEIWQELLGVPQVGRNDNFTELGGHSLLVITLSTRIQEKFKVKLPLEALFSANNLASLNELIVEAQATLFSHQEVEEMEAELANLSDEDLLAYLED